MSDRFGYGEIGLGIESGENDKQTTNADRIRSMTDEELAVFLSETSSNAIVVLGIGSKVKGKTVYDWWEWLKEEVQDG